MSISNEQGNSTVLYRSIKCMGVVYETTITGNLTSMEIFGFSSKYVTPITVLRHKSLH